VAGDRHATVAGHDQPEADQAQINPFLLGLAAVGDRARWLPESMKVAKLVISTTSP
jgi:hypothetical protein